MIDEREQLRAYAESGSDHVFAGIVQRNLPMIYAVALRRVGGDSHRAQDVVQQVFISIARNAARLGRHPNFTGWLFLTTRFLAAKAVRSEVRRRVREQQASLNESGASFPFPPGADGMLDQAIAELREVDRRVILLRFHRGCRLAEIGNALGLTENAVQKRLDRALTSLREKLSRRGLTSTVAALGTALELQSAVPVPAGLAGLSTQAALAAHAGVTGWLGLSREIMLRKFQVLAVALVAGSAGMVWQRRETIRVREQLQAQAMASDAQVRSLLRQIATQAERASAAEADLSKLMRATPSAGPKPIKVVSTQDLLRKTEHRMDQLIHEGKQSDALAAGVETYRMLSAKDPGSVEGQILMSDLARLGRTFPPAIAALRELRDSALQEFYSGRDPGNTVFEIALLNQRLGEGTQSVALFDALPAGSPLRQSLALLAQAELVAARRYADALAGQSYGSMLNQLDRGGGQVAAQGGAQAARSRDALVEKVATDVEVLAGAGKSEEARELTARLLAFDGRETTRSLIDQHVRRALSSP